MGHVKLLWWTVLLAGIAAARGSFAGDEPLKGVLSCRAVSEASARLACFDRETAVLAGGAASNEAPLPARQVPPPPPVVSGEVLAGGAASVEAPLPARQAISPPQAVSGEKAPDVAPPPLTATQQFGLTEEGVAAREVAAGTRAAEIKDLKARVTAIARDTQGRLIFTLDNGQAWKQLKNSGDLLVQVGDTVTVSRGLLHSFEMTSASGRFCKVDRVK